jgi:hypothetical protein
VASCIRDGQLIWLAGLNASEIEHRFCDNNWKLTGRFGVQSFGGAQLLNLTPFQPFTQPIVRFDLDRMDDDDNRLFGITAQIAWTPKPSYQLTLRTPLYAIRN